MLEKFQKAASLDGWVQVFRFTLLRLGQRRQVYVVLDLSTVGNNIEVMNSLVAALRDLIGGLQSEPSSIVMKIMLLASRRVSILDTEQTSSIMIGPPKDLHFGLVASGDQVMKSGEHRDRISGVEGVVAFEMEAAGAWDHFSNSCVVIKGVCDYADSHKNKRWQRYAAATAAAYMRAFLDKWSFRS
ncbi:nb-arc and tpr domain protein [Colletotrichum sojae]|uniref:Nb-arc and tpr domain protein n=1 Tax=Colletotrichum sojae TaxID=2175907 RepID=A0A8H6IZZ1_9PEZI|nr:nb-arc and tpr domain protein [Colletotrichum sojae]